MAAPTSPFAFALCQPGSENFLKAEIKRLRPDLHPALQRPGLVSFKATAEPFDVSRPPRATFARAWSASAGPAGSAREIADLARALGAAAAWVSPRDLGPPGDVPPALEAAAESDAAHLRDELSRQGVGADEPPGKLVLDVITAPGERPVVGWHVHAEGAPGPGGRWAYPVPSEAPSRAYGKIVESLLFTRAPVRPGQLVLEIGAAPGGGTLALAERRLRVLAIDTQPLDARVLARPGVAQVQKSIGEIDDFPAEVEWLACDAGVPPADVLAALARIVPRLPRLQGLFWTLKLVHASDAANLQRTLARLAALGLREPVARQLPAHRRDLLVYARGPATRVLPETERRG